MTEWQRKKAAMEKARKELEATKRKYRIGPGSRNRGSVPSPLVSQPFYRQGNNIPTSDRIITFSGKREVLHEHKWKRGAGENSETVKEIYRKASRIAPAYNKGALMYLPEDFDK